ncbi:transcriptional repressor LexA [Clostridium sp. JS66]|uniref:transcriptional repressor LexA n=1 Tax=Clostridium sp. JS66 TaxID=3064705 RepID=UPI00298E5247|nr:transcriptional repressor LexA [Clostridium sp. JS66]WPC42787.1 transcriptional repressor LexA [Clostridium sp. JS66]
MAGRKSTKQKEIYEFIKQYIDKKEYSPTVREICAAVGLKSTSTVHEHLGRLEKKGLIKRDPTKPRTIEIIENSLNRKEMITIPIIGTLTAGLPILSAENIEDTFQLPVDYIQSNKELFMLKVNEESMIDAGILNGDYCIIEKTNSAKNGDIIAALVENKIIIRRFFEDNNLIKLQPENPSIKPIIANHCKIMGKLVGIYRSY